MEGRFADLPKASSPYVHLELSRSVKVHLSERTAGATAQRALLGSLITRQNR